MRKVVDVVLCDKCVKCVHQTTDGTRHNVAVCRRSGETRVPYEHMRNGSERNERKMAANGNIIIIIIGEYENMREVRRGRSGKRRKNFRRALKLNIASAFFSSENAKMMQWMGRAAKQYYYFIFMMITTTACWIGKRCSINDREKNALALVPPPPLLPNWSINDNNRQPHWMWLKMQMNAIYINVTHDDAAIGKVFFLIFVFRFGETLRSESTLAPTMQTEYFGFSRRNEIISHSHCVIRAAVATDFTIKLIILSN